MEPSSWGAVRNYRHSGESRNPEWQGDRVQSETPSLNPSPHSPKSSSLTYVPAKTSAVASARRPSNRR